MKRSEMTITPTILFRRNLFRDVRGGALSRRVNRRVMLGPILLVLVLIMLGSACRKQPAAVEIKGPILGMMTATGLDDKGQPQNPSFAFAPTEPQLVVIVQIGRLDTDTSQTKTSSLQLETVASAADDPIVNIAWYQISDESEQKLFEHQVKVQSYERAYSIGKSRGTLKTGSYKVKATLAGQTQETELEVRLPNAARSSVGEGEDAATGAPPVDGGSGTVPGSSGARATSGDSNSGSSPRAQRPCDLTVDLIDSSRAAHVTFAVMWKCPETFQEVSPLLWARVGEALKTIDTLRLQPGSDIVRAFAVDPCYPGSKDLPGTRMDIELEEDPLVPNGIVLGPDQDAPKVSVNSSPVKGTKVKAGDVIKIDATASERRTGGTWQTGVQRFQLVRMDPGGGIEELIQEVTDPSRLPKPCDQKAWSKVLAASYKVPDNPPPVIKLCAIAEDYAGNENFKCGEFPTVDVWEGTLNTHVTVAGSYKTCTGTWRAKIKIVAGEDGTVSGEVIVVAASGTSCDPNNTYAIKGSELKITGIVNDAGFTIPLSQFIGEMVQESAFIQKSGRNQASGTATPSYSFGGGLTNSFVMKFELTCKTCAP